MNLDWKDVPGILTGVAAVIAAVQSWRGHNKSEKANATLEQIKTDIKASNVTNVTVNASPVQTAGNATQGPQV